MASMEARAGQYRDWPHGRRRAVATNSSDDAAPRLILAERGAAHRRKRRQAAGPAAVVERYLDLARVFPQRSDLVATAPYTRRPVEEANATPSPIWLVFTVLAIHGRSLGACFLRLTAVEDAALTPNSRARDGASP